jgi:hypothetical protein
MLGSVLREIWGSYDGDYEDCCFLGHEAVQFATTLPTLRSNPLPPFPWKKFYSKEEGSGLFRKFVTFYQIIRRHIPDDSIYKYERNITFSSNIYVCAIIAGTAYRLH